MDVSRIPCRVMRCEWADVEEVQSSPSRRLLLARAPHHIGVFHVSGSSSSAAIPQPHRRLTSSCFLREAAEEGNDVLQGTVIAAGDESSSVTVLSNLQASPDCAASSTTLFIGKSWDTMATGRKNAVQAIIPSALDGSFFLSQRQYEPPSSPARTVWMASVEQQKAWAQQLPAPHADVGSSEEGMLQALLDVRPFTLSATAVVSGRPSAPVVAASYQKCTALYNASTLVHMASFPLRSGSWRTEAVQQGEQHLFTIALRSRETNDSFLACYDVRQPQTPVWWRQVESSFASGEDGHLPHEQSAAALMEPLGRSGGFACMVPYAPPWRSSLCTLRCELATSMAGKDSVVATAFDLDVPRGLFSRSTASSCDLSFVRRLVYHNRALTLVCVPAAKNGE